MKSKLHYLLRSINYPCRVILIDKDDESYPKDPTLETASALHHPIT